MSSSSSSSTQARKFTMEACSVARIMSLGNLATRPPCLCSLFVRGLPWLLPGLLPPGLLKRFYKDEHAVIISPTLTTPELPQDILMSIFDTLEIPDLIRASSVCAAYTGLRSSLGLYRRPQTPCLLYTSDSDSDNVVCLYSLVEKRSYKLTLPHPPIQTRRVLLAWLAGYRRREMHLVNPVTGEQVALPSVATIEQVNPVFDEHGVVSEYELSRYSGIEPDVGPPWIFALGKLRDYMHHKAFVFFDTSTDTYIVVLIHKPLYQLSFARLGDDKWTWLPHGDHYQDCLYKDGLLYAVTTRMVPEIHAYDLSGPVVMRKTVISITDYVDCWDAYIAQAPSGDLLLITRRFDSDLEAGPGGSMFWNTAEFEIFMVDSTGSKAERINSLPDHVLFLGHNQSLCLSAQEYLALKADHCYFTDDCALWTFGFSNSSRRDIKVLNLRDNSTEELVVSPQLWSDSPAPVWITPDLGKMSLASGCLPYSLLCSKWESSGTLYLLRLWCFVSFKVFGAFSSISDSE